MTLERVASERSGAAPLPNPAPCAPGDEARKLRLMEAVPRAMAAMRECLHLARARNCLSIPAGSGLFCRRVAVSHASTRRATKDAGEPGGQAAAAAGYLANPPPRRWWTCSLGCSLIPWPAHWGHGAVLWAGASQSACSRWRCRLPQHAGRTGGTRCRWRPQRGNVWPGCPAARRRPTRCQRLLLTAWASPSLH